MFIIKFRCVISTSQWIGGGLCGSEGTANNNENNWQIIIIRLNELIKPESVEIILCRFLFFIEFGQYSRYTVWKMWTSENFPSGSFLALPIASKFNQRSKSFCHIVKVKVFVHLRIEHVVRYCICIVCHLLSFITHGTAYTFAQSTLTRTLARTSHTVFSISISTV